jgi:lysophospholipase L1-like esterase
MSKAFLALIIITILGAQPISAPPHDSQRMKSILVLGDSDGEAADSSLTLPDAIHPNATGQKILAENAWRVLEPIARETTDSPLSHVR